MDATGITRIPAQSPPGRSSRSEQRRRQQAAEGLRYFLLKEGTSPSKPEFGQEISSEGEALIKAFQTESGVLYVLRTYRAVAEIQGGSPTLVKRPLQK